MMKLTGIGDPSGVGEAFNLLREDERKPNKALLSQSDGALCCWPPVLFDLIAQH